MRTVARTSPWWVGWALCVVAAGCTPTQYASQADRAAYTTLASGQQQALGVAHPFDVAYRPFRPEPGEKSNVIRAAGKDIPLGDGEPVVLTLDECLEVAFRNSRTFQNRREDLYGSALALANARRSWNWPQLGGDLTGDVETSRTMKGDSDHAADAEAGPTLTQRFVHGGALTLGATVALATDLLGWRSTTVGSLLEANFTQPLLRGAWRGLAYENQYRLERDFLFSVFEYERFTQTFVADIVREYYRVLQARDTLANQEANIQRLEDTFKLTKAQAEGGQVSSVQADQAEQSLLQARIRLESNKATYQNQLDEFKLALGLPIRANVALNYPGALEALNRTGLKPLPFEEAEAIAIALSARPDMLRERAALRDAARDVEIAADEFLPQLDLELGINAAGTEPRKFYATRFDKHTRFASLTFDYELDQTDNRDAYRDALISLERAKRDLEEFVDRVRLDVRQSYRDLVRSRENYSLEQRNVEVAERRSRLAALELKEGLASARDVLEAEEDLRNAQNGQTSALITYTTTRLTFLATLGVLGVDEKGKPHEREEPFKFDRIGRRYGYLVSGPQ